MADTPLSKAAVDRAGKRLRDEVVPRPEDVAVYEEYRASLSDSLNEVMAVVQACEIRHRESVSGRLKRIESVVEKLRRQHTTLTQIQDLAGCRVVVRGLRDQDEAVTVLREAFPGCHVIDRRTTANDSGYKAVHLVVRSSQGTRVEIQVRTVGQHDWAQYSEVLVTHPAVGLSIKYGGGPAWVRSRLMEMSQSIYAVEQRVAAAQALLANSGGGASDEEIGEAEMLLARADAEREHILETGRATLRMLNSV